MNLQEQTKRIKSMMGINESRYEKFKKNWKSVGSSYTSFVINEPLSLSIYLFPDEKGFLVELFLRNKLVGDFHSVIDDEMQMNNDIQIDENHQGLGLGKVLLLVAIDVSNNYLGFFQSDVRGLTKPQQYLYKSLNNDGSLVNWNDLDYDVAQNLITKINRKQLF